MSLIGRLKRNGPNGFGYGTTAEDVTLGVDLRGRTILVTGAASGLGLETVRVLALRGARVIATGRSEDRVRDAVAALGGDIVPIACDLAEPTSVRACIEDVRRRGERIDVVVCNAGVLALRGNEQVHGYERQFFTNHIGHFLLVTGLLDVTTDHARIVILSSEAHRTVPKAGIDFDGLAGASGASSAYGQSKLANLLFVKELARRFKGSGRTANAAHPGVIHTHLGRRMSPLIHLALRVARPVVMKSIAQGAATQCYLAIHPAVAGVSGEYYADCNPAPSSALSRDTALARRLWNESERIVAGLA